jgi:HD-like signal output (HDOD) protein
LNQRKLFIQIFKDIEAGKINLPALPDLAFKVRDTLRDHSAPIDQVSKILSADTSLTAYIMRIANSPIYMGVKQYNDVQSAVIRLGYNSTRNIAMTYIMRSLFRPKLRRIKPLLIELWEEVSQLAAISSVLAKRTPGFNADKAMTAAMLQDIGALPIIEKLASYPELLEDKQAVAEVIDKYAAKVGAVILHKWGFDQEMVEVVRSRKQWLRDKSPDADLADLVLIARVHCYIGTPALKQCPPMFKMPAFNKLALGEIGPSESLLVLEHAKEDIAEIKQLLTNS